MLLMIVCGWHKTNGQQQAGVEQYYSMYNNTISFTPVAWYQTSSNLYFEGRYNYDAAKSMSLYAGKTFENNAPVSYTISTLFGVVAGKFNGLSAGINADVAYSRFSFSLQSQYTASIKDRGYGFIYAWSDISCQATQWLSAGLSMQQTCFNKAAMQTEKGVFVKASIGKWNFPLYVFNPIDRERYVMLGMNVTWQYKNDKTTASNQ